MWKNLPPKLLASHGFHPKRRHSARRSRISLRKLWRIISIKISILTVLFLKILGDSSSLSISKLLKWGNSKSQKSKKCWNKMWRSSRSSSSAPPNLIKSFSSWRRTRKNKNVISCWRISWKRILKNTKNSIRLYIRSFYLQPEKNMKKSFRKRSGIKWLLSNLAFLKISKLTGVTFGPWALSWNSLLGEILRKSSTNWESSEIAF